MSGRILKVKADAVQQTGIYCIKDLKSAGAQKKINWIQNEMNHGLEMFIALDEEDKQIGFIECTPSERAWRPVQITDYLFIHCIALFTKSARRHSVGSSLIEACLESARRQGKKGVCAMSSKGSWIANKSIYEKNGFQIVDQKDRFELMSFAFNSETDPPKFYDWTKNQKQYTGWNLIYSDQCPWHEKAVQVLKETSKELKIKLKVHRIDNPAEAQKAPSGFGTFALLHGKKLLADHYISRTRFLNIFKKLKS